MSDELVVDWSIVLADTSYTWGSLMGTINPLQWEAIPYFGPYRLTGALSRVVGTILPRYSNYFPVTLLHPQSAVYLESGDSKKVPEISR